MIKDSFVWKRAQESTRCEEWLEVLGAVHLEKRRLWGRPSNCLQRADVRIEDRRRNNKEGDFEWTSRIIS